NQIRFIAVHVWLRYGTAIFGRLILIYYQVNELIWNGSFCGYLTSLYEQQGGWTISISLISICIIEALGQVSAYLYAYEILSIQQHYILLSGYACGSVTCIILVYVLNIRIMQELKKGARIDDYSINRTYQNRENLNIIHNLIYFAGPTALFNLPCFLFYGVYAFLPENLSTYRFFAAEFYDLFTVLFANILFSFQSFASKVWTGRNNMVGENYSATDVYFMQLNAQFTLRSAN
ncbi:hypothetical protein PMAYCL1PPCAC_16027, partial [Pristionchus mayeri]